MCEITNKILNILYGEANKNLGKFFFNSQIPNDTHLE